METPPDAIRHLFAGPQRPRALWRVLIFLGVMFAAGAVVRAAFTALHVTIADDWTPRSFMIVEGLTFATALVATLVLAAVDRQPLARYGYAAHDGFALGAEGALWGFVSVAALVGAIAVLGGYELRGFAVHGPALAARAAAWLAAMLLIGLAEEAWFRGALLAALGDGLGFWPASILLSLGFGALHYFGKPMENLADAASVTLIGLFFCFTVRRTGSLWFAAGFHLAFDFAAMPLFGAPNTGNGGHPVSAPILASAFRGADWLTGGVRGVEASLLVFVVIAALYAAFAVRFRTTRFHTARDG